MARNIVPQTNHVAPKQARTIGDHTVLAGRVAGREFTTAGACADDSLTVLRNLSLHVDKT
jgi:hypothetical protein